MEHSLTVVCHHRGPDVVRHSHGAHPSAEKIAMHHVMMGMMAATVGSFKLLPGWFRSPPHVLSPAWEWLWAGLILLIGMQLLVYSE